MTRRQWLWACCCCGMVGVRNLWAGVVDPLGQPGWKYRRKSPIVTAVQWVPGKHVEGVAETVSDIEGQEPYICGVLDNCGLKDDSKVEPGDWIVKHPIQVGQAVEWARYVVRKETFDRDYEMVKGV